jgi:citrate lyase subunit beta / citryl-CoA lyase
MQAIGAAAPAACPVTVLRSLLFIPGDSEKKLGNGDRAGADALILDLEDSVLPANKPRARGLTADYLKGRPKGARGSEVWVRINALDTELALADLAAVVPASPDGVMLPKAEGPADVARLSFYLDALEAQAGLTVGSTRVLPVATETAAAPFNLGAYSAARLARLAGLTWGSEDLSTALGASTNRDASGEWAFTYRLVRSLTLMGARAAGVQAIDTLYADFRDESGLRNASRVSRAEGFTGRLAIHPAQVAAINESYLPSAEEVEHARRVIAAFEASPGAGAVGLDGKMVDIPHLKQAQALIQQAARVGR